MHWRFHLYVSVILYTRGVTGYSEWPLLVIYEIPLFDLGYTLAIVERLLWFGTREL